MHLCVFVCTRSVWCVLVIVPVCMHTTLFICFIILLKFSNQFTLSRALAGFSLRVANESRSSLI